MKKYLILLIILLVIIGCERMGRPDVHPENKKGDWYYGWRFDWEW